MSFVLYQVTIQVEAPSAWNDNRAERALNDMDQFLDPDTLAEAFTLRLRDKVKRFPALADLTVTVRD